MWALPGAWHPRQPQGAGGDPTPAVLGSRTTGKGRALPNLLLPDPSLLAREGASVVFLGCSCRFICVVCAGHVSSSGSAFAPWRSRLQLCPKFLHPGRARAGFGPVSLGVSLAPGLHWSGVLGNTGGAGMNGDAGAIWVLGILLVWRCPALAQPHVSGCSTELWGDQHVLSPLPQLSPGEDCISPAACHAGGGFVALLRSVSPDSGVGALGTLHCLNPPLCLAWGVQGPHASSGTHPLLVLAVLRLSCLWERSGFETLTSIPAAG